MIFSELYSAYYNAVAGIISCVIQGETEEKVLQQVVLQHAFSESVLTIIPSLKNEKWQLLRKDMSSPIQNIPSMPLTKLEKSWLKAISLDWRIRLFDLSFDGLENVEPLFTQEDFYLYDQYADGDPYSDEGYIKRFRMILTAIREKTPLKIEMENRKGSLIQMNVLPRCLEYSEKDDKFRLISSGCRYGGTVNLSRIVTCSRYNGDNFITDKKSYIHLKNVTLKICDERNALERCMLHFAHFEKKAERMDDKHYLVHIRYAKDDETEMVIRILSFGPFIEVIGPESFRRQIIERLQRQKSCELF